MSDLIVKPLHTNKTTLPQSPYMESGIINKFPSMMLNIGKSGSGKSSVIAYILTESNFMKDFFDKVYLFSPTAKLDDLSKHLKLKKENMITEPTEHALDKIITEQEKLINKKGIAEVGRSNKILIIFDDIVSDQRFLKSKPVLKLAAMGRHFLISSIFNTQSYTKIPRSVRLQANAVILFPSSNDENRIIAEDHAPPHCNKKCFLKLVEYATKNRHEFLFINNFDPPETRFRKGFEEYIYPK